MSAFAGTMVRKTTVAFLVFPPCPGNLASMVSDKCKHCSCPASPWLPGPGTDGDRCHTAAPSMDTGPVSFFFQKATRLSI